MSRQEWHEPVSLEGLTVDGEPVDGRSTWTVAETGRLPWLRWGDTEAWRQLKFEDPQDGGVTLDFNRTITMWFAFTDHAT